MKILLTFMAAAGINGQAIQNSGYFEVTSRFFPRTPVGDSSTVVAEALLRFNTTYRPNPWAKFAASFDARTDTHNLTRRSAGWSWRDRAMQRPAIAIRTLSASLTRGPLNLEIGKQVIRWGAADGVNPMDRFAPRDYVNLVDSEVLPVSAVRLTYEMGAGTRHLEAVFVPWMTPSRLPLARTRWMPLPPNLRSYPSILELPAQYPGGPQFGALWKHSLGSFEYSAAFYEGNNYNPTVYVNLFAIEPLILKIQRYFPTLRMYGGSLVWAGMPVAIRAEGGYFQSGQPALAPGDDYALFVLQADWQKGPWSLIGGYAAQHLVHDRGSYFFDPERAVAGSFLGRATYDFDSRQRLQIRGGAHRRGIGSVVQAEYSRTIGAHWRVAFGLTWIHGTSEHLLGQFGRNSHGNMTNTFSF